MIELYINIYIYIYKALETPYDGQFTLSTQVIKPNELITAPIDTASQFL